MTIIKIFLSCAGVALLAAPALAANQAAVGEPPVPGGDLGCVVRLALLLSASKTIANDPSKSEQEREQARDMVTSTLEEESYYLGRLSMQPAGDQRRTMTSRLFKDYKAEPADQQTSKTLTCSKWSRDHQVEVLQSMKSKA